MLKPSSIRVRMLFLALCSLLALNGIVVGAQDAVTTQEPAPLEMATVEALPTEVTQPPEMITPVATEAVTPIATEIVIPPVIETVTPVTTAEVDVVVTGVATTLTPEPALQLLVRETFDNGDLSPWLLGEGWSLVPAASGQVLQVNNSNAPAELLKGDFLNVAVQAEFFLQAGAAQITVRQSEAGNYTATLDASGLVRLFRSGELLFSIQGAPSVAGQANILRLSAIDGIVRVAVNNSEVIAIQDVLSLPPGKVLVSADFTLSADGSSVLENMLLVNDFFLWVKADESALYPAPTSMVVPTVQVTEAATEDVVVTQEAEAASPEIIITSEPEIAPVTETPLPIVFERKETARFPAPSSQLLAQFGPLSNDDFGDASLIPSSPLNAYASSGDTTAATLETDEAISTCDYNMSNTIWFAFTPTNTASYTLSTATSGFDTVLAIYTGTAVDNLTLIGCNDDATTTTFTSLLTKSLQIGVTYHIQLGGYNGRYGQYALSVVQLGLPAPTLAPVLTAPINNAVTNNGSVPLPALTWNAVVNNAHHYEIQIDDNKAFTGVDQQNSQIFATTYTVNPALPMLPPATTATTYYWRVRALNLSNQPGPWSLTRQFIVDMVPPPVPTQSLPAANALLTVLRPSFKWAVPLGSAVSYRLDVDDDPDRDGLCDFTSPVVNNLTVPALTFVSSNLPQGSYCWRVRSVDAAGNISGDSSVRAFTIFIGTAPLDKVVVLTAGTATNLNVAFKWAAVTGATSYTLTLYDVTCTTPQPGSPITTTLLTKTLAVPHGKYCWKVQALGVETATPMSFRTLTVSPPLPIAPVLISPVPPSATVIRIIGDNTPEFTWNATMSTLGALFTYELQVDNSGCKFPTPEINEIGLGLSHIRLSALLDAVYCWRVRTVNSYGVPGAWSITRAFTLDTVIPQPPTLSVPAVNAVLYVLRPTFNWVAAVGSGSVSYRLDVDDDAELDGVCDFALPVINDLAVAKIPYTIPTTTPALTQGGYCWRVQALDTAGNVGPESSPRALRIFIGTYPPHNFVAAPVGAALTASVPFKWATVAGATSYVLSVLDATCTTLANSHPLTAAQLTKTLSLSRGTHCWKVQAVGVDAVTPTTFFKVIVSPTGPLAPVLTAPVPPSATALRIIADNTPEFMWNATTSTANAPFTYEMQADNSGCTFPSPEINAAGLGLTHTPAELVEGIYCWRARSVNTYGGPGGWSTARSFTLDTTQPQPPTLSLPADKAVLTLLRPSFSWTAAAGSGSASYRLDVDDDPNLDGVCDFTTLAIENLTVAKVPYALPVASAPLPQASYCWRVQAVDLAGNIGAESSVRAFKIFIGTAPLDKVVVYSAGVATTVNVSFKWAAVSGATSYTLKLYDATCATELFSYAMATLLVKVAPVPHGVYCWKVQAVGMDPALPTTFRTLTVSPPVVLAPVLISPAVNGVTGDNTPEFSWNGIATTTGAPFTYDLQVDNSGCTFPTSEINLTALGLNHTPLTPLSDLRYCWRVRAVSTYGVPGVWSAARYMTVDTYATGTPNLATPLDNASLSVPQPSFSWGRVVGATSYQVQIKTVGTSCDAMDVPLNTVSGTSVAFVPSSPLLNRTYYWCVRALDSVGNPSPWSARRAVKIISAAAAVSILNRFTVSPVKLSWGAINWVVPGGSYQVQVDNNAKFLSPEYASGNLPAGTQTVEIPIVAPLTSGTWYWHVRACSAAGVCGLWSTNGTFTIETP